MDFLSRRSRFYFDVMHKYLVLLASVVSFAVSGVQNASAQWMPVNGPPNSTNLNGANVTALATIGTNLLVGTKVASYGIYRSTDSGTTWSTPGNLRISSIGAFAVLGTRIFAGMNDSPSSLGVLSSSDSGATWSRIGLANTNVRAFAVRGSDLYAATIFGVYHSPDTGATWTNISGTMAEFTALTIKGSTLYAGTKGEGVFASTNNGKSWVAVNNGLLTNGLTDGNIHALAVCNSNLFAGTYGGVYRSTDNGATWTATNTAVGSFISALAVSGSNLFAASTNGGIFLSTDDGTHWTPVNTGFKDLIAVSAQAFAVTDTYLFTGLYSGGVWWRPLSDMISPVQAAYDTQMVSLGNAAEVDISLSGDSSTARTHRIDFVNNSGITLIIKDAVLTTSDDRFSITQLLPGVPDTLLPSATFSAIVRFRGDTIGTTFRDTIVLTVDHALMSYHIYLSGNSVNVSRSGVSRQSARSSNLSVYPNPFSQSATITFTSEASGRADISIVNQLGVEVARIFSGEWDAGEHAFMWGKPTCLPDGMYECVIRMNGQIEKQPIILIH
jgi:photosystem II stability/assembly factor-like uncharacterized protein